MKNNEVGHLARIAVLGGLAGLAAVGAVYFANYYHKHPKTLYTIGQKIDDKYTIMEGDRYTLYLGNNEGNNVLNIDNFYSSPRNVAGISAEIRFSASDMRDKGGIEKIILYEDGKEVFSRKNEYHFTFAAEKFPLSHNEPGTHTYQAEVIDINGNSAKSKEISVQYTGKTMDLPPNLLDFLISSYSGLSIFANDEGDNKGIKEILLYEDNKMIKKFESQTDLWGKTVPLGEFATLSVPLESLKQEIGIDTYFAEVIDLGGNKSKSRVISIEKKAH